MSVGCTPHPTIPIIGTIIIDRDYSPFALEISMLAYDHFNGQNNILRWVQKERNPCIKKPEALMSNYASCKKCWPGPTFAKLSFKDSAIIQSGGAATIRVSVLGGGITSSLEEVSSWSAKGTKQRP